MTPEPDQTPASPLDSALELAALGWRVVPITPHKKHPPLPAWQDAATTDPNIITNWWTGMYRNHGIGVACGRESGVWVLDVDVADGKHGLQELGAMVMEYGELPPTPTAQTGTGGWHYYFAWPDGLTITNGMSVNLGEHLDIRGEGGQVLAPPTVHPNGNTYAWCEGLSPWDVTIADAPHWLLDLLDAPKPAPQRPPQHHAPSLPGEDGPAARYNATHTWDELLAADGWELTGIERGGEQHWRRPLAYGPTDSDTGATVGYKGGGALVVFTTSIPWLPPAAYSRFGYYACRWHGGDRSAAARHLKEQEQPMPAVHREIPNQPITDPTDPGPQPPPAATQAGADTADTDPLRGIIQIQAHRLVNGWDFIHGVTDDIEPLWGHGDEILWAKGEPCLLVGPSGVGKSTLTQQVLRSHLDGGDVLGYPVTPAAGKTLYLAMDRPAQIARSMARMFGPAWESRLKDRLVVWRGPLPFSIVKQPEGLAVMCDEFGAQSLFIDSVKDMAPKMSDEETGSQINAAFQMCIVAGVEVFGIHHQRKAQGENKKPNKLADVYGSQMMVNGAGSVILLWGEAGDPVVELSHLKQPMETVGPLTVTHDHYAGITTADERTDALQVLQGAFNGVDTPFVAAHMFGPDPTRNDIEKARRRLEKLVRDGLARVELGEKGGVGGGRPTMWYPITTDHGPITISPPQGKTAGQAFTATYPQAITGRSRKNENSRSSDHDTDHDRSRKAITEPPFKEGVPDDPAIPDEDHFDYPDPDEEF